MSKIYKTRHDMQTWKGRTDNLTNHERVLSNPKHHLRGNKQILFEKYHTAKDKS